MAAFVGWGNAWGNAWGASNPGAMQGAASFAFGGSATLTTDTIAGLMQASAAFGISADLVYQPPEPPANITVITGGAGFLPGRWSPVYSPLVNLPPKRRPRKKRDQDLIFLN